MAPIAFAIDTEGFSAQWHRLRVRLQIKFGEEEKVRLLAAPL